MAGYARTLGEQLYEQVTRATMADTMRKMYASDVGAERYDSEAEITEMQHDIERFMKERVDVVMASC